MMKEVDAPAPAPAGFLTRVIRYKFMPSMVACGADYLGLAMMTPALPYFLEDTLGLDPTGVSVWTGAITTAQYAGGAFGNMLVGWVGDRLGSRKALVLTLGGDVVLFALTALATSKAMLISVRFFAGLSSPLVPSLMYIFERARHKMEILEGVNAYSASVNMAYAMGGIIVGVGYGAMGWVGLNLFSSAFAAVALVIVAFLSTPPGVGKKTTSTTGG
eukprot:CAMPEP_0197610780 /NCGR_PEP_ID=MMETSP1326-20131121/54078_1 /TAXON_ID=1155430 /ORGANISM="Genus nov. species nov., Strain RCC2288" /LENGTH=216 /DNA_ID=CAMNT_0043179347 /DNA_START=228 /DNA_END=874 /DNA_ORIENTATION=+